MPSLQPTGARPSYASGYATCAAESAYPELWRKLRHAWVPALGPSGRIIDLIGKNHGTPNGGTPSTSKGFGFEFTASSSDVDFGQTDDIIPAGEDVSIILHYEKTNSTPTISACFGSLVGGVTTSAIGCHLPFSDGTAYWDFGGNGGVNRVQVAGLTFGNDVWCFQAGRRGNAMWQNGVLVGGQTTNALSRTGATNAWKWGEYGGVLTADPGIYRVFLMYHRHLRDDEVKLLSRDPLAPFRLKRSLLTEMIVDLEEEVDHELGLVQDVQFIWDQNVSAEHELLLVDEALSVGEIYEEEVDHELGLTDEADGGLGFELEDELVFTDEAEQILFIGDVHHLSDDLGLTDEAVGDNASIEEVEHELEFVQTITFTGPIYRSVQDWLNIDDEGLGAPGVPWLPIEIEDILEFEERMGRGLFEEIEHDLALEDAVFRIFTIEDTLSLVDDMEYGKGSDPSEHELDLEHEVLLNAVWVRSVSHTGFINDGFTYFIDTPCNRKNYTPFEGGESSMPEPRLQFRSTFTLETLSGTHTILVLRNPETDDRDRLSFQRINRETRGGELSVYTDPIWGKVNTLLFTIVALKRDKIDALQTFLLDTLGQEIKLSDWTGSQWRGVVTTPNETATEDGEGYWTFTFEFEGFAYPGQAPEGRMILTQVASAVVE